MDSSHGNGYGNGTERRASAASAASASSLGDDDYDLSAMAIADGFRPSAPDSEATQRPPTPSTTSTNENPFEQDSITTANSFTDRRPPRPSSITKPPRTHDSLALRHDGALGHLNAARLSRDSNGPSASPFARPASPYEGPSAPSHPYQMYPQRTMSVATSTTVPVSEQSYHGPQRPTHPYGLYTQSTEPVESGRPSDMPVGFSRHDNYQRRIGPDGEEIADLIGPLGHTEELPPYTRYPDEAYARKTTTAAAEEDEAEDAPPAEPISGAGGIGLATRNPEFESQDDLNTPRSRMSTRSDTSDAVSQHQINTAADAYNEKEESSGWRKAAKRRMWGVVPYWAICLVAVALLLMGIILGAVIGTLFAKDNIGDGEKPDEDAVPVTLTTATMDTIPLPTKPADLPPLEIGIFSLPPLVASQAPTTCFNDTSQAQAWTCNVPFTIYSMGITRIPNGTPISDYAIQLTLSNNSSSSGLYAWGTQPPTIDEPIRMRLVNDTDEPSRGPAWFGQVAYNKTVIIAEDRFPNVGAVPASNEKRGEQEEEDEAELELAEDPRKAGVSGAQVGNRPWICTWPGTLLEVFIYPSQNNSFNQGSASSSSLSTSASESLQVSTTSSTASTITAAPDGTSSSTSASSSTRTPTVAAPSYPNVMKIEESRLSDDDSRAAVCQQVEICDDGISSKPVLDEDGEPIEVIIVENQRLVAYRFEEANSKRWIRSEDTLIRRDDKVTYSQLSECGCMWWFT